MVAWIALTGTRLLDPSGSALRDGLSIAFQLGAGLFLLDRSANWCAKVISTRAGPSALGDKLPFAVATWWIGWLLPQLLRYVPWPPPVVGVGTYAILLVIAVATKTPGRSWLWLPGAAYGAGLIIGLGLIAFAVMINGGVLPT